MRSTHRGAPWTEARRHAARTPGPTSVRLPRPEPRPAGPPRRARRGAVVGQGRPARLRVAARAAAQPPAQGARAGRARGPQRARSSCSRPTPGSTGRPRPGCSRAPASRSTPRNPQDAWDAAKEAIEIAERGLLPGLEAPWIDARRGELADLRVEALETLAAAGARLGGAAWPVAEQAARAAVQAQPFRESARAVLMEVLRARGNVNEALRVYEDIRVLLREELGSSPGAALVAQHEQLLRDDPVAAPRPAAAPAARPSSSTLVERDREVALLDTLLREAGDGEGRAVLIEGPPGIGKSRLMSEFRRRAGADGALVLNARAGELEREFPFGVVRQLFETVVGRPAARSPAPRPPRASCSPRPTTARRPAATPPSPPCTASTGSTLNLAAERPLLLEIDDLHWCDRPSLRFLAYLVRRLEGQPVLVTASVRTGDPPTDAALLAEIANDPATAHVRPGPLSEEAVGALVARRLGAEPDAAFREACHRTTGGNPLLVRQLLNALETDTRPARCRARRRRARDRLARGLELGAAAPRAPARRGLRGRPRRRRCSARAPTCPPWPASPGSTRPRWPGRWPRWRGPRSCAPSRRPASCTRWSATPSTRACRSASASCCTRAPRASCGGWAPRRTRSPASSCTRRGAGDPEVASLLHEAGIAAMARGAIDNSVGYLRRALDEPPPAEKRPHLLLDLGEVEALTRGPDAAMHLREAYRGLTDVQPARAGGERARPRPAVHLLAGRGRRRGPPGRPRPAARDGRRGARAGGLRADGRAVRRAGPGGDPDHRRVPRAGRCARRARRRWAPSPRSTGATPAATSTRS